MTGLATVNLGNPQTWHDPTMAEKNGKPNRRSNNTAHQARKMRAMITQCKISGQRGVKSFPFTGSPNVSDDQATSHLSKAYRHQEYLYLKQNKGEFGCSLTQKTKIC